MSASETSAPRLLSVDEAARLLGVCGRHVRNLAARGQIRLVRLGRRTLVPKAEVERIAGAA